MLLVQRLDGSLMNTTPAMDRAVFHRQCHHGRSGSHFHSVAPSMQGARGLRPRQQPASRFTLFEQLIGSGAESSAEKTRKLRRVELIVGDIGSQELGKIAIVPFAIHHQFRRGNATCYASKTSLPCLLLCRSF